MSSSLIPSTSSISSSPAPSATAEPIASSNSNSNLYLFTFLATLILLLAVSCSVVARAIIVRRRFRRRVDRAMAQGLVLAPGEQGSHALSFGTEPKLFDVWLSDRKLPLPVSWKDITPISAQPVPDKEACSRFGSVSSKAPSTIASEAPPELLEVCVLVEMPHPPAAEGDALPELQLAVSHSLYQS
ncbi:hypothetical protein B0H15DRAFT_827603 [Mycena belliarum]|uniref:Uncharacterized protein n=1 Tax=Mycena belliarum TaxID=1033014 RepID=A0AAD6UEL4_9AGAR|nr:hypothetical protein B0H15DRAFT_827603 [Mycena belliae]